MATSSGRAGDTEPAVTLPLPLCDLGKITPYPHPSVPALENRDSRVLCLTWLQGELVRTLGMGGTEGGGSGGCVAPHQSHTAPHELPGMWHGHLPAQAGAGGGYGQRHNSLFTLRCQMR